MKIAATICSAVAAAAVMGLAIPATAQHYNVEDAVSADVLSNPFEFSRMKPVNTNYGRNDGQDRAPAIATDRNDNWIAVWESKHDLRKKAGTDWDIFYSISTDKGKNWTNPQLLNTNGNSDTGDDRAPTIASGIGPTYDVWIVTWHTNDSLGGTIGTDNDIVWSKSLDEGATWSAPEAVDGNANTDSGSDVNAQVRVTQRGDDIFVCVWESNDSRSGTIGTDWDIMSAKTGDGRGESKNWPDISAVNTDATTDNKADRNADVAANFFPWIVVWERKQSRTDYDVLGVLSNSTGVSWGAQQNISNSDRDSRNPAIGWATYNIATLPDPNIFVVLWEERVDSNDDWDIGFATGSSPGTNYDTISWDTPGLLNRNANTDSGDDRKPAITLDTKGRYLAIWESREDRDDAGTDRDLFWSRSTNDGANWSAPRLMNSNATTDTRHDRNPSVATDTKGKWLVVWRSNDEVDGDAGTDDDIYVTRTKNDLSGAPALTYP